MELPRFISGSNHKAGKKIGTNREDLPFWQQDAANTQSYAINKAALEAASKETVEIKKEIAEYGLAGNIKPDNKGNNTKEMSAIEIDAVTRNIRTSTEALLSKEILYQSQGKNGEEVERLLDLTKNEILTLAGVMNDKGVINEKMLTINDNIDDLEIRKSKTKLKNAVEGLKMIGKIVI